jgi:hypothetical protein
MHDRTFSGLAVPHSELEPHASFLQQNKFGHVTVQSKKRNNAFGIMNYINGEFNFTVETY